MNGVKSALLCSQGDPQDLWQPPGDGVSLRVNPGRGGGGTGSDSKENSWCVLYFSQMSFML